MTLDYLLNQLGCQVIENNDEVKVLKITQETLNLNLVVGINVGDTVNEQIFEVDEFEKRDFNIVLTEGDEIETERNEVNS